MSWRLGFGPGIGALGSVFAAAGLFGRSAWNEYKEVAETKQPLWSEVAYAGPDIPRRRHRQRSSRCWHLVRAKKRFESTQTVENCTSSGIFDALIQ